MHKVLLLGSGKIGRMITSFLGKTGDYEITVADRDESALQRLMTCSAQLPVTVKQVDAGSSHELYAAAQGMDTVISALSYRFNPLVAEVAAAQGLHYFDLTEDVQTTKRVRDAAAGAKEGRLFLPQCGLAPGFVAIAANHLAGQFDQLDSVFMRVGALPQFPSNALKYNLTWSTDGLINEYCNPCEAIVDGEMRTVLPLEGLEYFSLDGVRYEAFNTSGGLGALCESLHGRVRELNYKTIRYLGHRDLMTFLVNELRLSGHREEFKTILERAIPVTFQDVVVVFCTASGWRNGQYVQLTDARKIYHQDIDGEHWSAIQLTTASGICTIVDMVRDGNLAGTGFMPQHEVSLDSFLANRFGRYYHSSLASQFTLGSMQDVAEAGV